MGGTVTGSVGGAVIGASVETGAGAGAVSSVGGAVIGASVETGAGAGAVSSSGNEPSSDQYETDEPYEPYESPVSGGCGLVGTSTSNTDASCDSKSAHIT